MFVERRKVDLGPPTACHFLNYKVPAVESRDLVADGLHSSLFKYCVYFSPKCTGFVGAWCA